MSAYGFDCYKAFNVAVKLKAVVRQLSVNISKLAVKIKRIIFILISLILSHHGRNIDDMTRLSWFSFIQKISGWLCLSGGLGQRINISNFKIFIKL